jgi:hypothetical protein
MSCSKFESMTSGIQVQSVSTTPIHLIIPLYLLLLRRRRRRRLLLLLFLLLPLGAQGIHETLRFTSVSYFKTVGRTPWTGDQPVARPLPNTNTA